MKRRLLFLLTVSVLITSCGTNHIAFSPTKKYSPEQLQHDYTLYQNILETHHPSLYWYTPKDSMDYFFNYGRQQLNDSLTEPQFRKVLDYVTAKIDCGHTSVRSSKKWSRYSDTAKLGKMFPLSVKSWPDTSAITQNLNRKDTALRRGCVILNINGHPIQKIVDTMFQYTETDGYNLTHKYQSISNRGAFGYLYTSIYGLSDKYKIDFLDLKKQFRTTVTPVYNPALDTINRNAIRPITNIPKPSKRERRAEDRNASRILKIDSTTHVAFMDLSTFSRGYGLIPFFRNSFRTLNQLGIPYLIIDVRNNGGGSVGNSNNITRYLVKKPFKVCDTLYAIKKRSPYQHYIQNNFWNKLFITLLCKKHKDGNYHFGYFERHHFKPKKNNHYDGKVYVLTGGNSFSATTLFVEAVAKEDNVIVVGEETGGGAYGNSAWLIPDVTLPETGVRFRLPIFRLVIDTTVPKIGRGVQPEVFAGPTVEAIRRNADFKLDKAMELIKIDKEKSGSH